MAGINRWTRSREIIFRRVFFAGGQPLFRWVPSCVRWGDMLSIFWLGTELVVRLGAPPAMTAEERAWHAARRGRPAAR